MDDTRDGPPNYGTTDADAGGQSSTKPRVTQLESGLVEDRTYASLHKTFFGHGSELTLGGYRVLKRLGVGGMAEVHLCEDPSLGRRVALKRVLGGGEEREQARLRREALVLADLKHEHVVEIYELLELDEGLFIVMEYVEGKTLHEWLKGAPPLAACMSHLLAAGRGLAAVHDASFVHRDFKPENVLVGVDGRIKVADFGLALPRDDRARRVVSGVNAELGSPERSGEGGVSGTELYMAPEQLRGERVDALSDQFAYCIVAYEALWGQVPFSAANRTERRAAMASERLLKPASLRRLFRVLRRGLRADPAQRWPNMDALLDALVFAYEAPVRRRRMLRTLAGGAVFGGLVLASVQHFVAQAEPSCEQLGAQAWDEEARTALDARAQGLGLDEQTQLPALIYGGLDRWRARHDESCATPELRSCLAAQAQRVEVFVAQLLASKEHGRLVEAAVAVHELPDPRNCAGSPRPLPPAVNRIRFAALVRELDELHALRLLGEWAAAHSRGTELEAQARALNHGPLLAEVLGELAKLADEAGTLDEALARYHEAEELALLHGQERLAAELGLERAQLLLVEGRNEESARELLHWTQPLRARVGLGEGERISERFVEALLAERDGDHAGAKQLLEQALVSLEAEDEHAPGRREIPALLSALALLTDELAEAQRRHARALELAEAYFGPGHPRTALYLYNYGAVLSGGNEDAKSRKLQRRASALWTEQGPRTRRRAAVPMTISVARERLVVGDYTGVERAAAHLEQLLIARGGKDDPERGVPAALRARAGAQRASAVEIDPARRVALRERALADANTAIAAYQHSGTRRQLVDALLVRVDLLLSLHRLEEAAETAARQAALVEDDPLAATHVAMRRAEIALRRGAPNQADARLHDAAAGVKMLHESNRYTYTLLRTLCNLRLGARPEELEVLEVPKTHWSWLIEELSLSPRERAWFRLEG